MMQFRSCLYCNRVMTLTNHETICSSCLILVDRSVDLTSSLLDRVEPELDDQVELDEAGAPLNTYSTPVLLPLPSPGLPSDSGAVRRADRRVRARTRFRARNPEAFAYEYYNLTGEEPGSTFAGEHLPPLTLASEAFQLTREEMASYQANLDPLTRRLCSFTGVLSLDELTSGERKKAESMLQKLKTRKLTKSDVAECNMECAICTEKFEYSELTLLPCNHEYHSRCVYHWLRLNASCPICRFSLASTTDSDEEGRERAREHESPMPSPVMTPDFYMMMFQNNTASRYSVPEYMDDVD